MVAALAWAASKYIPGEEPLALIGCIPMLTAIAAYGFVRHYQPGRAAVTFGVGAVLLTTALFALASARVGRHQTFDSFVAAAFRRSEDPQIGTLGVLEPSWVFYTQRPMEHLFAPELTPQADQDTPRLGAQRTKDWQFKPLLNAWRFLDKSDHHFIITAASVIDRIGDLPSHVEVVARTPYFLRNDELLLLATRPAVARGTSDLPRNTDLR
jgi:hypothetical protein